MTLDADRGADGETSAARHQHLSDRDPPGVGAATPRDGEQRGAGFGIGNEVLVIGEEDSVMAEVLISMWSPMSCHLFPTEGGFPGSASVMTRIVF